MFIKSETIKQYKKCKYLFALLIPALLWYILFRYAPLYGVQIAFKDYKIMEGIWASEWVGLDNFRRMFTAGNDFLRVLKNTVIISSYHIIFGFPAPIILALLLNEIKNRKFKRIAQTITYLPHFMSWVILAGILTFILSPNNGIVNQLIKGLGFNPIFFLGDKSYFRFTLITTAIWKEIGWGSIIYLATLSSIDPTLYEAAIVDGAGRWRQMLHITLPSLMPIISIMLVMRVGNVLNAGFDQILNLYNPVVMEVADVIDTYVYRVGLGQMQYSLTTAVGLFKNVIAFALVLLTDKGMKKMGQPGLL